MKAARGMEVLSIFSVSCWRVLMLPHYVIKCLCVCGVMRFEFSVLLFAPPPPGVVSYSKVVLHVCSQYCICCSFRSPCPSVLNVGFWVDSAGAPGPPRV